MVIPSRREVHIILLYDSPRTISRYSSGHHILHKAIIHSATLDSYISHDDNFRTMSQRPKILHTILYTIVPSRDTREFIHVILQSPGVTVPQYYTIACDCAPCSDSLLALLRVKYDSSRTSVYMRYAVVDRSGKDTLCSRVPTHHARSPREHTSSILHQHRAIFPSALGASRAVKFRAKRRRDSHKLSRRQAICLISLSLSRARQKINGPNWL